MLVLEPSSLAMFRRDMGHLLGNRQQFERLSSRTFEPLEYIAQLLEKSGRKPRDVFDVSRSSVGTRLFYHSHCQQKTVAADRPPATLLRDIGFDVVTSSVECCGMAGSFGYNKEFYDLSMAVGADLLSSGQCRASRETPRADCQRHFLQGAAARWPGPSSPPPDGATGRNSVRVAPAYRCDFLPAITSCVNAWDLPLGTLKDSHFPVMSVAKCLARKIICPTCIP